jgi:hypothetical protein
MIVAVGAGTLTVVLLRLFAGYVDMSYGVNKVRMERKEHQDEASRFMIRPCITLSRAQSSH